MKKTLITAAVIGLIVTIMYVVVTYNVLLAYNGLINTNYWLVRMVDWMLLGVMFGTAPGALWVDLEKLHTITHDDLTKGTLDRNFYHIHNPLITRFALFVARHKTLLYILLILPLFYFWFRIMLWTMEAIGQGASDAWFWITCKWDDMYWWFYVRF
jgi:hypothetical protein